MAAPSRRTWTQRLVLSLNIMLVFAVLAAAVALLRYDREVSQITRIASAGTLAEVQRPTDPINVLVVGVDNAEGLNPDDPVLQGRQETSLLSDTIMVARIDPTANKAWLLSIPRDLWVPISGMGTNGRINEALALGGPEALIATINDVLDIPINHYVQVNFAGFRNMVETIGGVPVWFEYPTRDANTGLNVETVGCVNLEGEQALAYVRSRYLEVLIDDEWISDPTADQGRMARQQTFVRAALNRASSRGARNPIEVQRLINATRGEVVLDDNLSLDVLLGLGEVFRDFNADDLEVVLLPIDNGYAGRAAVGFLRVGEAQPLLGVFRGQATALPTNSLARVQVLNGSAVPGQGADAARQLEELGFSITGIGDLPGHSGPTELRYAPGGQLQAVLVARYLDVNVPFVEVTPDELPAGTGVLLVTGDDWNGVRTDPLPIESFQRQIDDFNALLSGGAPDGTPPAVTEGPTVADLEAVDDEEAEPTATTAKPQVTTTTVTPQRFVPTPPAGVECG